MCDNNETKVGVYGLVRSFMFERGVRWRVFIGVMFACLAAGASVGLVGLAGWFIAASALAGVSGAAAFVVAYPSSGIRAFAVTRVVFRYLERLTNHGVTFSLLSRLRVYFFERALEISTARYGGYRSGDLLGRATSDIDSLDNVFPRVVVPTLAAGVVCIGAVGFIAYFSPMLAVILGVGCVVAGVAVPFASSVAGKESGVGISRTRAVLRTEMIEAVEGLPEVRSYGAGGIVAGRLTSAAGSSANEERRARRTDALGTSFGTLAAQMTVLVVLLAGISAYSTTGLAGPIVALAVLLATGVFEQLGALPAAYRALGTTRAAAGRLGEIFSTPVTVEPGKMDSATSTAGISLDGVTLRYEGRETPAIEDISFTVERGRVAALVGGSGTGKTTILGILAGELAPERGSVEVGRGHENISYASQDEHIFDATLRENLRIAAPEAGDDVLLYVLDAVGMTDFYMGLQSGLDTAVGEHGREISGGQKRRLSVARALLRRPDVLLLDEPTGSLDDDTATRMLAGIRRNLPEATIVIATHDPEIVTGVFPEAKVVVVG